MAAEVERPELQHRPVEPVNQALFQQKIQRPVNRRRRTLAAIVAQHVENRVSAHRFGMAPDDFQHPPPQIGQADAALLAQGFGLRQRIRREGMTGIRGQHDRGSSLTRRNKCYFITIVIL